MKKKMIIDAIIGNGFNSIQYALKMVRLGLARFSGNQWNESWEWKREEMEKMSIEELIALYIEASEAD